jgi:hypothetical protein
MFEHETQTKPEGYYLYTGSEITYENRHNVHGFALYERALRHDLAKELVMNLETCDRLMLVFLDAACQFLNLDFKDKDQRETEWQELEYQMRHHHLLAETIERDPEFLSHIFTSLEHIYLNHYPMWHGLQTVVSAHLMWHWSEPTIPEHVTYFEANPNL